MRICLVVCGYSQFSLHHFKCYSTVMLFTHTTTLLSLYILKTVMEMITMVRIINIVHIPELGTSQLVQCIIGS